MQSDGYMEFRIPRVSSGKPISGNVVTATKIYPGQQLWFLKNKHDSMQCSPNKELENQQRERIQIVAKMGGLVLQNGIISRISCMNFHNEKRS